MQALKVLVIVLGVLIVIALALVAYGVVTRVSKDARVSRAFGDVDLPVPAGCVIADANSRDGGLILRLDGPAERGCQQVVIIDLGDGAVLGRVTATPGP